MEDCFDEFGYQTSFCSGVDYYFDTKDYETSEWVWDWSRTSYTGENDCGNRYGYEVALSLTGYFINSKSRPFKGSIENTFKTISDEQVRLKNY
ncbi:hypothetical protein CBLAS_0547 [Campylobacter blaseri]|uniref:Uncharacterized protein n=1 Tax=Campylobacter blaseri TaxID=2042961 RepID=A0A2P8R0B1_9BACT|nr:hypothetical protein [Campylobacter blaseri]PSM51922.1 hypothetical protein CQ405_04980 [Campylobacter blaseri]PSM53706.1 hypothetical protein CRN67_04980 [Campylobacter blaseri]QKF85740.1 hypothetical protein CBLAS_0547 [Campylobacter blaseri]